MIWVIIFRIFYAISRAIKPSNPLSLVDRTANQRKYLHLSGKPAYNPLLVFKMVLLHHKNGTVNVSESYQKDVGPEASWTKKSIRFTMAISDSS
ncbi:hypothetical protein DK880_00770 [Candidatus Cardinium hertigii]|uniref:Uncharacterized protein n=1 Tax=Candidatus Cardinium hertigii TaxID=247481 RepID=A0A2Z3L9N9_9BACT|nr:hypothetical protein DK880_00770 [Candidatus Cardinium hertigii]